MGAQIVGWIAFTTASLMLVPQVIKVVIYKKTNDISLYMFIIATLNYLLWIIYGSLINSPQVYIANILAFICSLIVLTYILIYKIKYKKTVLTTESQNPNSRNLDKKTTHDILKIINNEDEKISNLVLDKIDDIEDIIDNIFPCLREGGRLFYVGAGTSGRIGVLDASEIFPTYGVKNKIIGIIAGGEKAIKEPVENAEDSLEECVKQLEEYSFTSNDCVIVIGASGKTPCCIGVLEYARSVGSFCAYISMNINSEFSKYTPFGVEVETGAEVVTGSTRMKAGTATKLVLNMISTTLMIKLGYVVDNYMINMQISNKKLEKRAINMISTILNVDLLTAKKILVKNNYDLYKSLKNEN